jgi:hypothetical protein
VPTPSLNRGVLILLAPNAKDPNLSAPNTYLVFQYNPEKLLHTLNPATSQTPSGPTEVTGPPVEYFNLTFDLDSLDLDPPNQNQIADTLGIHPSLAILESMMQPQTVSGQIVMPIVVFKWGSKRVVAVRVVSMNVEEKTFDQILNPTRATVTLILRVLNASEVGNNTGARNICASHTGEQAILVDAYRTQTGQTSPTGAPSSASSAMGLSSAAGVAVPNASATKVIRTKVNIRRA